MSRRMVLVLISVCAGGAIVSAPEPGAAATPPRRPQITTVEMPYGVQGFSGQGPSIVIGFRVSDPRRRSVDVEVQYGVDRNGDGIITGGDEPVAAGSPSPPDEYVAATENRADPRNTRLEGRRAVFRSGRGSGAPNAFVWYQSADIPGERHLRSEYLLTPQGRQVPDPVRPGEFLLRRTPGGSTELPAVKARLRTRPPRGAPGPWVYSPAFDVDDQGRPSASIDGLAFSGLRPTTVDIRWTAFDPDSEDLNGNGVLDIADGEDLDGNGLLDPEYLGVAFDWHVNAPGEDPASMTPAALEALSWQPCTRDVSDVLAQTDALHAEPGVPVSGGVAAAREPDGRQWVFGWNVAGDIGVPKATAGGYTLRARPFDQHRTIGRTTYVFVAPRGN